MLKILLDSTRHVLNNLKINAIAAAMARQVEGYTGYAHSWFKDFVIALDHSADEVRFYQLLRTLRDQSRRIVGDTDFRVRRLYIAIFKFGLDRNALMPNDVVSNILDLHRAVTQWNEIQGAYGIRDRLEKSLKEIEINKQYEARHIEIVKDICRDWQVNTGMNPCAEILADPHIEPRWMLWNDATPYKIACNIYRRNQWKDLPILADALEEGGCDDFEILTHCRTGHHYRGCWLINLLRSFKHGKILCAASDESSDEGG